MIRKTIILELRFPSGEHRNHAAQYSSGYKSAQKHHIPIVLIKHIADPKQGFAPFPIPNVKGAGISPQVLAAAGDVPIVVKYYVDSFEQTKLQTILKNLGVDELIISGIMTQNCVAFTALAKVCTTISEITILTDATKTVSELLHHIALRPLSTQVHPATTAEALTLS